MTAPAKLYTVEEFERLIEQPENADRLLELIHGKIIEKVTTEVHSAIALKIDARILVHVETNKLGGRAVVEVHHRVLSDDYNARIPDVSYTTPARLLPITSRGSVPQLPDLAVEVKSPNDSYRQIREKAQYYLQNGVSLVWLVFPEKQIVEVYTPDSDDVLNLEDTLTGGDILPGFALPLKDIFDIE